MSLVTSSEGLNVIYRLLIASILPDILSGYIYIGARPDDSDVEDIVINDITITTGSTQLMFANVNLFVRDIQASSTHWQIDSLRIKELSDIIMSTLNFATTQKYTITVEENSNNQLPNRQHYANFRLLLQFEEPVE